MAGDFVAAQTRGPKTKEMFLLCICLITTLVCSVHGDGPVTTTPGGCPATETDEQRLHKCLLSNLDPTVRPAKSPSETVNVKVDSIFVKVMNMDEKSHILSTASVVIQRWVDFQLQWNPDDYGGLQKIRIPVKRIWNPDIVLFNNADETFGYKYDNNVVVMSNGSVTWAPHARLHSYCQLDLARFPFDTQKCILIFGSWSHDVSAMNISQSENKKPGYILNGNEWEIKSLESKRHEWSYGNDEKYSGIIATMALKRKSSFYQYVYILPTVIFAILALLIPFVHPLSQERITYCVALLLGCVLVLMMLDQQMPSEIGTVPVVAAYLAYLMVMLSVSVIFTIVVSNMYLRDHKQGKVPGWVRWIFLTKLNKAVCLAVEPYTALPLDFTVEENTVERELLDMRNGTSDPQIPDGKSPLERTMEDIRRYLRVCAARATMGEPSASHKELVVQEWLQVARVIDRLVFVSFLILTIVITISMYSHY